MGGTIDAQKLDEELKQDVPGFVNATSWVNYSRPATCPTCGRCPTCGKGGWTYPYYEYPDPYGTFYTQTSTSTPKEP